jgi:uncharacterized protein
MMKILVFGDTHGHRNYLLKVMEKARQVDLVICLGDLTVFEQDLAAILDKLSSLNKKILLIHGNHEHDATMRKLCDQRKNLMFIHDGFYKHKDYLFIGYGGGGFAKEDKHFAKRSEHFKMLSKNTKVVLVLHQPPYGVTSDLVETMHTGNINFRDFIEETQPMYAFCGHIHEGFKKQDKIGETIVVNPGPEGMIFDI